MPEQPFVLLYDASGQPVTTAFAPVTGRPGAAHYSSQGGLLALGSDMAGKAQVPRVDSAGNQYVVAQSPGGGAATYQAGNQVASATAPYGPVVMGLQSTTVTPLRLDTTAALIVAQDAYPTFAATANVGIANNRSMMALVNRSAGSVLRLVSVFVQNTATQTGTLLASYPIVTYEVRPITGISTAGTAIAPVAYDVADTLPDNIDCQVGATVSGDTRGPIRRWFTSTYGVSAGGAQQENVTADQQGRDAWVTRADASAKQVTVRPGAGVHLRASVSSASGSANVTFVFTVAPV